MPPSQKRDVVDLLNDAKAKQIGAAHIATAGSGPTRSDISEMANVGRANAMRLQAASQRMVNAR